jgi:hypothetical protein
MKSINKIAKDNSTSERVKDYLLRPSKSVYTNLRLQPADQKAEQPSDKEISMQLRKTSTSDFKAEKNSQKFKIVNKKFANDVNYFLF